MTDRELLAAAVREAHATTVGYLNKRWTRPPAGTHWAEFDKLVAELDTQLAGGEAPVPEPVPPPAPTPTPTPSASSLMVVRHNPGTITGVSDPSRFALLSIPSVDRGKLSTLRAKQPAPKIICYRNASFVTDYSHGPDGNSAVTFEQAQQNGWFLKKSDGTPLRSGRYASAYFADIGAAAFRQAWIQNVVSWAKADGFDGVFLDDLNADISWHLAGQPYPPKYPTRDAYAAAMGGFIATVGPALKDAGLLAVPNLGALWDQPAVWSQWAPYTTGVCREHFMSGNPPYRGADWGVHAKQMRDVLSTGRAFYGLTYGALSDTATQRYIRASFLLFHNPSLGSAYAWDASDVGAADPYVSGWTWDLGAPLAAAVQNGAIWTRKFERGTITVDTNVGTATTTT